MPPDQLATRLASALEGLAMAPDNFARLQRVQANLMRAWGDAS